MCSGISLSYCANLPASNIINSCQKFQKFQKFKRVIRDVYLQTTLYPVEKNFSSFTRLFQKVYHFYFKFSVRSFHCFSISEKTFTKACKKKRNAPERVVVVSGEKVSTFYQEFCLRRRCRYIIEIQRSGKQSSLPLCRAATFCTSVTRKRQVLLVYNSYTTIPTFKTSAVVSMGVCLLHFFWVTRPDSTWVKSKSYFGHFNRTNSHTLFFHGAFKYYARHNICVASGQGIADLYNEHQDPFNKVIYRCI